MSNPTPRRRIFNNRSDLDGNNRQPTNVQGNNGSRNRRQSDDHDNSQQSSSSRSDGHRNRRQRHQRDNHQQGGRNRRQSDEHDNSQQSSSSRSDGDINRRRSDPHGNRQWRSANRHNDSVSGQCVQGRAPRKMGFLFVQQLIENDDLENVIQTLLNDKQGFKEAMTNQDMNGDFLLLLLTLFLKITESAFLESRLKIFDMVFRNSTYIDQLRKFIQDIPNHDRRDKQRNKYFWDDPDNLWYNILKLSKSIMCTPALASEVLPKLLKGILRVIPNIEEEHSISISKEIINDFEEMHQTVVNLKEKMQQKFHKQEQPVLNVYQHNEDEMQPPEDFRTMSIYPSIEEITIKYDSFLRHNKTHGSYQNVAHYLDVQFRLLREDFVAPLRSGVCQYLENPQLKKFDDIRIHPQVQFLKEENINEMRCFKLKFDMSNKKRTIKYENSKQFMFGSLMCFTCDKFKTVIFGKIVQRDMELIKKGELVVGFEDNVNISFTQVYLMVESKIYFEPYYCVLNALQNMDSEKFPLERYIVYAHSQVNYPTYITDSTLYIIDGASVFVKMWPADLASYNFNPSQEQAFRAALTQEISVIQGPPGTGKTFLGLRIARTLLKNSHCWYKQSPMLVICYTNHALDQFLEGIAKVTDKLLRVGGQSKNEQLNKFNIRNQKAAKKSATYYQMMHELKISLGELNRLKHILSEFKRYDKVVDFHYFSDLELFQGSWYSKANKQEIEDWLLSNVKHPLPNNPPENLQPDTEMEYYIDDSSDDELSNFSEDENNYQNDVDPLYMQVTNGSVEELNSLGSLENQIKVAKINMNQCQRAEDRRQFQIEADTKLRKLEFMKHNLERISKTEHVQFNPKNPYRMTVNERWDQYNYFLKQVIVTLTAKQQQLYEVFQEKHKLYSEQKVMEDLKLMKGSLVIGMTTTGAARLRSSLMALRNPIVIVEEAAEVLEAHICSALTPSCKQLILIGDHKQLRPKAACYKVETVYSMGISLFERMINNNIQCFTLNTQHRMKPEICDLIRPVIYPDLKDDLSVKDRPRIVGVEKDLYFIDHRNEEQTLGETSKKNDFESVFCIKLARYLILNGYKPENITIVAAYLGQMFEMQREKKKHLNIMRDVRIAVLDNYQGEESDIILLSLVRNNKQNSNGFLKIENRVCVALSRARNGLYILGNLEQLCNDRNSVWPKIKERLEEKKAVGPSLELRCELHKKLTLISTLFDFSKVEEGGCDLICNTLLVCNHKCKKICHTYDRDHNDYECMEKCQKLLCTRSQEHICTDPCYKLCRPCYYIVKYTLPCSHIARLQCHEDENKHKCMELVPTKLPCGHEADKPCHIHPEDFLCPHPCEVRVEPCGHACSQKCHVRKDPDHLEYKCKSNCAKIRIGCSTNDHFCRKLCYEECEPCITKVKKARTVCTHHHNVPCNSNVDDIQCERPCKKKLACGHPCKKKCFEACGPCVKEVSKTISSCGHSIKVECHFTPTNKDCKNICERKLNCGHKCVKKCRDPCTDKCLEMKPCNLRGPCGHLITEIKCFERLEEVHNILQYCTAPCKATLKCDHKCKGTCSKCSQGRIHARCLEKCDRPLLCNHLCPNPCREACKPCEQPCVFMCTHSRCGKKCGDICTKCNQKCRRICPHQRCLNKCGDICSVPPCGEPCEKKLACGHSCVGFCNEPCPTKCRICDKEELTTIVFGSEDDEDARFVMLADCKHIIESDAMETWLENGNGAEIQAKVCPLCKTPITNTQRYSDYVKKALLDIYLVKKKLNGEPMANENMRQSLDSQLNGLALKISKIQGTHLQKVLDQLNKRLALDYFNPQNIRRRQAFNTIVLTSIAAKIQIVEQILEICNHSDLRILTSSSSPSICNQINLILNCLMRDTEQITKQETEDIQNEINRLHRIVEIHRIKLSRGLNSRLRSLKISASTYSPIDKVENLVFSLQQYTKDLDREVVDSLKKLRSPIQISEAERKAIVQAMGLTPGHWYVCPNGHPYVITECGGAMQQSTCPECNENIGGSNHALLSSNRVATEMDGSRHSAWSDAANMHNYDFD